METTQEIPTHTCSSCAQSIPENSRYCSHCGAYQQAHERDINVFNSVELRAVLIYYFITLLICLLVKLEAVVSNVYDLFVADAFLAITTLAFTYHNRKEFKGLFSLRRVKPLLLLMLIPITIVVAFTINILVEALNRSLFEENFYFYHYYSSLSYPKIAMVLSIAMYPAVFEEVAFRGFLYNYLNKLFDDRMTIIITAFLFALLHLSFFGSFWLFG
ncbi:MAG: CPBP family glutamic-type intramembrane protease, partial [Chitinophagaceae bacterium]